MCWTVGDLFPVGVRFSTYVQNKIGALPTSYTIGTEFFPVVNRPGRGVHHPPSYGLDCMRIESRQWMRYSTPVETGTVVSHSLVTGTFPGVKPQERGVDQKHHVAPSLKKE